MHHRPLQYVMPRHHVQHVRNMEPNLFACNDNSAYIMPCVTAHAVTSCMHRATCACRQASHHMYTWCSRNYLWMCHSRKPNDTYQKIATSHIRTVNMKIANQNVLKMILIAMHNKNKAIGNENF